MFVNKQRKKLKFFIKSFVIEKVNRDDSQILEKKY